MAKASKPKSPTWTPFKKTGTGKSYTPKAGESASKQHLKQLKSTIKNTQGKNK